MQLANIVRYGLWGSIVTVAAGNRRAYQMTTTWLPHLAANTITLLLPDIYRLIPSPDNRSAGGAPPLVRATLDAMIRGNPRYVLYVAPLAAGYLLSSPWFNIYKGKLAEVRLAGFGLDAIPHTATAFALARLICDTADTGANVARSTGARSAWIEWCAQHHGVCSAVAVVAATLVWEWGEYRIHMHELAQRGTADQINMQWSVGDTIADCIANAVGWLLALV